MDQSPPHHQHTTNNTAYAAIDLGSSNCRMLMAKPLGDGFRVFDSFSRIVRLAEGIPDRGLLCEDAIIRTINALKVCAEKIHKSKAPRIHAIGTEACRRATNNQEFTARIKSETGLVLETISSEKEAQLTLTGCAPLLSDAPPRALIFDIGGGSTELMWVKTSPNKPPRLLGMLSIPFGVVALAERFGTGAISSQNYTEMMALAHDGLSAFDTEFDISQEITKDNVQMLGTSGTITMLGGLYLELPCYVRSKVDGLDMDCEAVLAITARLATMGLDERSALGCIGRQRAEMAVGGCAFLEAILHRWPVKRLRAVDRGIREGLLLGMMAKDGVLSLRGHP